MTSVFSTTKRNIFEGRITSLADIFHAITQIKASSEFYKTNEKLLFRGQNDASYELLPSLWRPNESGKYYNEALLIDKFLIEEPSAKDKYKTNLELLSYAQHYGLPTRLLDWTTNLLVAIYFACEGRTKTNKEGKVFCLEAFNKHSLHSLNKYSLENAIITSHNEFDLFQKIQLLSRNDNLYFSAISNDRFIDLNKTDINYDAKTYSLLSSIKQLSITNEPQDIEKQEFHSNIPEFSIYIPPKINSRLKAQHGCFTIHMGKIIDNYTINFDYLKFSTSAITEIIIPANHKQQILNELDYCGINKQTLFPELEYQTEALKQHCFDD